MGNQGRVGEADPLVYPHDFEQRIGFAPIREEVVNYAQTEAGKKRIRSLTFSSSIEWVQQEQLRLCDMLSILRLHQPFPREGYLDIGEGLHPLKDPQGWLSEQTLHTLRSMVRLERALQHFYTEHPQYTALCAMHNALHITLNLEEQINTILHEEGYIRSNASPQLQALRQQIEQAQRKLKGRMESLLQGLISQGVVEDSTQLTVRAGTQVIPIPSTVKNKLKGVVVDRSTSGQTLFIKPFAILELEQDLAELQARERQECVVILIAFTQSIRPYAKEIETLLTYLYECDSLLARARYAVEVYGASPIVESETTRIYLRSAHHPLLLRKMQHLGHPERAVPLTVELNSQDRILLISGPNAGGKSVCLKCIGAAVYMHQCGFLPFLAENSELSIFKHIYLDLGDKQSIEDDLSTYSSHLLAQRYIAEHATQGDLFLIDELGSGTEPHAGAALAEALLEHLVKTRALGVVTTHFGNLKSMEVRCPALFNGAMLFDTEKLEPLYELETHALGSSYTFAIARRMGLSQALVNRAKEIAGSSYVKLEQLLEENSRERRDLQAQRKTLDTLTEQAHRLQSDMEQAMIQWQTERRSLLQKARREAKDIVQQSTREVERTIRQIKEVQAQKESTRKIRARLKHYEEKLTESLHHPKNRIPSPSEKAPAHREELAVGDHVQIAHMGNRVGEIVTLNAQSAVVALGQMLTTVPRKSLTQTQAHIAPSSSSSTRSVNQRNLLTDKRLNFHSELDVRGQRTEEALQAVGALIDDALLVGVHQLRVLHGKGYGVLKERIAEFLSTHAQVKEFHPEDERLGGAGITVIKLR